MVGALTTAVLLSAAVASGPRPDRHETAVETLHRKGVYCMEVIERRDCAIEKFEAVLNERSTQRELVTDSMLRLIKLYEKESDGADQTRDILRRFWDVGMKRRSTGHIPYTTRYFPGDLNILLNVDVGRIVKSPISNALGDDVVDFMFTCNESRRADIRFKRRWKRAEKKAKAEGRATYEVYYERLDAAEARREAHVAKERNKPRARQADRAERSAPLFVDVVCPIAKALGQDDVKAWRRMTGMMNHQDFRKSMAVAQITDLDRLLEDSVKAGRLKPLGRDRWVLPDFKYHGEAVHLAKLDHEELMVATASNIDHVAQARRKRRPRMNKEVVKLLGDVPRDTGFFFVMNQAAVRELGLGNFKKSTRSVLEVLLPKPKGIQMAGVFYEYFGLFTRMPTDQPVKGRMLVSLANTLIGRASDDDAEARMWLENLDIAEAEDRRALLATYVLNQRQIEKLMWDSP